MDPRLLEYYNSELQHLREMGAEFAQEFPKIAGRLGLDSFECADPYVERLLEGFAFMAARVQLKIDSKFPDFSRHMLELLYPHYLRPTPSMLVAQLHPDLYEPALAGGLVVPRGTGLRAKRMEGQSTSCMYRSGQDCKLWPIELLSAEFGGYRGEFGSELPPNMRPPKGAMRLRLRATGGLSIRETGLSDLCLYLGGGGETAVAIYRQLLANTTAIALRSVGEDAKCLSVVSREAVRAVGFEEKEALLPTGARSFSGYRLLQEYFAFPQRFLFVELQGLSEGVAACESEEIDLFLLSDRRNTELDSKIERSQFSLFCVPAINLFEKQADPIHLGDHDHEFRIVPDKARPLDYEVFSVEDVVGYGRKAGEHTSFRPLYAQSGGGKIGGAEAHYTLRRQPRLLSSRQRERGGRSSYIGSELYLNFTTGGGERHGREEERPVLRQLAIKTVCTNRDLPMLMPVLSPGDKGSDFTLDTGAPVDSVRCVAGPTPPRPSHAEGETVWRLLSHLSLNYLSLVEDERGGGAQSLRELLSLYGELADDSVRAQIEGLSSIDTKPITRRLPVAGPPVFGRGLELTLVFDEMAFEGSGAYLLASVLERFLARYVSINGFTETVLRTVQRGEIARWPARIGQRPVL